MKKRVIYPDWVEKHRQKGTNISCIGGKYYLYAVSSKWNKEKGRAQKKTDAYLGRITEEGLIPKGNRAPKAKPIVTVKEYGATAAIAEPGGDLLQKLREKLGKNGEVVFTIATSRLIEQCPFKRTENQYINSYISEILPGLSVSPKDFSRFSRSSIESGYFIEQIFPMYGVRFISVGERFDSDNCKAISKNPRHHLCTAFFRPRNVGKTLNIDGYSQFSQRHVDEKIRHKSDDGGFWRLP